MAALEGARVGHAAALAFCAGPPLGSIQRRMPLNLWPHMVSDRRWRRVDRVDARNIRVGQPVQFRTSRQTGSAPADLAVVSKSWQSVVSFREKILPYEKNTNGC